jgi:hypothetical protein
VGDIQVHANEVRQCRACYQRIVWLESANRRRAAFNVPDGEAGKSWLAINDKDFHNCASKERLMLIKGSKTKRI